MSVASRADRSAHFLARRVAVRCGRRRRQRPLVRRKRRRRRRRRRTPRAHAIAVSWKINGRGAPLSASCGCVTNGAGEISPGRHTPPSDATATSFSEWMMPTHIPFHLSLLALSFYVFYHHYCVQIGRVKGRKPLSGRRLRRRPPPPPAARRDSVFCPPDFSLFTLYRESLML